MSRVASYMGLGAPQVQVERLSTASTALTLTDDQQSKLLIWEANASASRITLPSAEEGMVYTILCTTGGVSSATKFIAGTGDDFLIGDTTASSVVIGNASTVERGAGLQFIAINDNRWFANRIGASTLTPAST